MLRKQRTQWDGDGAYAIADVNHERHQELLEWWGSSDYDPSQVDARNLGKNVEALAAKWKRRSRKKA